MSSKRDLWHDLSSVLLPCDDGADVENKKDVGATIIYCPSKKEVDKVAEVLEEHGIKVWRLRRERCA